MTKPMKTFLRQSISDLIEDSKTRIEKLNKSILNNRESLIKVEKINFRKSLYEVKLDSIWCDCGEASTITSSNGSLENAIITAESEFMKINNREDVQAEYLVSILINKEFYKIPEVYWEKYTYKFNK